MNLLMSEQQETQPEADAPRIRLIVDTTAERRQAVRVRAAKLGLTISELVESWIDKHCAKELRELQEDEPDEEPSPDPPPRPRKPRK